MAGVNYFLWTHTVVCFVTVTAFFFSSKNPYASDHRPPPTRHMTNKTEHLTMLELDSTVHYSALPSSSRLTRHAHSRSSADRQTFLSVCPPCTDVCVCVVCTDTHTGCGKKSNPLSYFANF